jgi:hypothetical protein
MPNADTKLADIRAKLTAANVVASSRVTAWFFVADGTDRYMQYLPMLPIRSGTLQVPAPDPVDFVVTSLARQYQRYVASSLKLLDFDVKIQ